MDHKRPLLILTAVLLMLIVTGCSSGGEEQTKINTNYPYPYPDQYSTKSPVPDLMEGYPAPATEVPVVEQLPASLEIKTPLPSRGNVTGRLILKEDQTKPYLASGLYLGELLWSNKTEAPPLASFSNQTDPRGIQDRNGYFLFENIEPGMYVIYIYIPYGDAVIEDPKLGPGSFLYVDVKAGVTLDLGEILIP